MSPGKISHVTANGPSEFGLISYPADGSEGIYTVEPFPGSSLPELAGHSRSQFESDVSSDTSASDLSRRESVDDDRQPIIVDENEKPAVQYVSICQAF